MALAIVALLVQGSGIAEAWGLGVVSAIAAASATVVVSVIVVVWEITVVLAIVVAWGTAAASAIAVVSVVAIASATARWATLHGIVGALVASAAADRAAALTAEPPV